MQFPTTAQRLACRCPDPDRNPVMTQRWSDLLFVHWEFPKQRLQQALPPGLFVDTFEERAFLGIIPFRMRQVAPSFLFPVPWISYFLELNVRTYVHDEEGIPGVWFFSLDANQPLAVAIARRWFHLNYQHASMNARRFEGEWFYHCQRRGKTEVAFYVYPFPTETQNAAPETLDFFLLERYFLYSYDSRKGQLYRGQVAHPPYDYQIIETDRTWSKAPARWNNLEPEHPPVHAAIAQPVRVKAYAVGAVTKSGSGSTS